MSIERRAVWTSSIADHWKSIVSVTICVIGPLIQRDQLTRIYDADGALVKLIFLWLSALGLATVFGIWGILELLRSDRRPIGYSTCLTAVLLAAVALYEMFRVFVVGSYI